MNHQEFRHRVRVAEEKRQSARTKASTYSTNRGSDSSYSNSDTTNGSNEYGGNQELNSDIYGNDGGMGGGAGGGGGGGMRSLGLGESKIQYVRHMVFQYLTCKDAIVKPHIESALIALFRYNDLERIAIDDKRKSDTEDTITSISNYLGLFTSS